MRLTIRGSAAGELDIRRAVVDDVDSLATRAVLESWNGVSVELTGPEVIKGLCEMSNEWDDLSYEPKLSRDERQHYRRASLIMSAAWLKAKTMTMGLWDYSWE